MYRSSVTIVFSFYFLLFLPQRANGVSLKKKSRCLGVCLKFKAFNCLTFNLETHLFGLKLTWWWFTGGEGIGRRCGRSIVTSDIPLEKSSFWKPAGFVQISPSFFSEYPDQNPFHGSVRNRHPPSEPAFVTARRVVTVSGKEVGVSLYLSDEVDLAP